MIQRRRNVRKLLIEDVLASGIEIGLPVRTDGFKAMAIELELVAPLWAFWNFSDRQTVHRLDEADLSFCESLHSHKHLKDKYNPVFCIPLMTPDAFLRRQRGPLQRVHRTIGYGRHAGMKA